ncbi:MAG: ABC transporter substrate-binding protein [Gammaproteobacteria bacterium]
MFPWLQTARRTGLFSYSGIFVIVALVAMSSQLPAQENATTAGTTMENGPDTATVPAEMETVAGPGSVVQRLHTALLEVMKNSDELGYEGRYEKLKPVISAVFDTPLISRVILSRYWRDLSETEQSEFIDLFTRLSTATYASRFDGYNGEEFTEAEVVELQKGRQLIKTRLDRRSKKAVTLDYLVHRDDGEWRIISVIADGVNDLSLKRAEYAVVIKDKGYRGLLQEIQSKIDDMESDS